MGAVWSSQTLSSRLPGLVRPFEARRIENSAYALGVGSQVVVTGGDATERQDLSPGQCFEIPTGQFAYILTEEVLEIPHDALGLLSMKFGHKMRGLINVSGFHVDPGYRGKLLFAVYNAGPQSIILAQGEPAFLLWYLELDHPSDRPYLVDGDGRTEITSQDMMKIQGKVATPQALASQVDDLERRVVAVENLRSGDMRTVRNAVIALVLVALLTFAWNQGAELVDRIDQDGAPSTTLP